MTKSKSLLKGIGNQKETRDYYDDLAIKYDSTLKKWNYKAPNQCVNFLLKNNINNPKCILDLACGTGLFAEEIKKNFLSVKIDGSDISSTSLRIAKKKKIYSTIIKNSFEKKFLFKNKYDVVSLVGAMTYCRDHKLLFNLVLGYLKKRGYFIFTQRIDLWKKFKFDNLINDFGNLFFLIDKSRSLDYLPKNKEFSKRIKIRIVLLQKK